MKKLFNLKKKTRRELTLNDLYDKKGYDRIQRRLDEQFALIKKS